MIKMIRIAVISVCVVLLLFVFPSWLFGPITPESRVVADEAEMKANITILNIEIEKYKKTNGIYPASIDDLPIIKDNIFYKRPIQQIDLFAERVSRGDVTYIPTEQGTGYRLLVYHKDLKDLSDSIWNNWLRNSDDNSTLSYYP